MATTRKPPPKGNGNTSKTATMRSNPNHSMTVTSDKHGNPVSYTEWDTSTGRVKKSGSLPLG